MKTILGYKIHPAAELYPLMDEAGLNKLAEDIRKHGLIIPITLFDGMILDGRNRALACEKAGVAARFQQFTPAENQSAVEYVLSVNSERRHMKESQLAMVAEKSLPMLEAEAKERQRTAVLNRHAKERGDVVSAPVRELEGKGKSAEKAAKLVGVSTRLVEQAKQVREQAPDLAIKVEGGQITLKEATRQLKARETTAEPTESEQLAKKKKQNQAADAMLAELRKKIPARIQAGELPDQFENYLEAITTNAIRAAKWYPEKIRELIDGMKTSMRLAQEAQPYGNEKINEAFKETRI